jgi:hypothetical protein
LERINLPTMTLCAVTSVNVEGTIAAMRASMEQVAFADCLLLTNAKVSAVPPGVRIVNIDRVKSAAAYSEFMLSRLIDFIATTHCLIVQWDGFVLDGGRWDERFLDFDYVGAPWPQFSDGHDVGNGGFSLRSARLLKACRDPRFVRGHPEDVAICRTNRPLLENEHGIRFADRAVAARFACERTSKVDETFGFHGAFNMVPALGAKRFGAIYRTLDDRSTVFHDYWLVARQLARARSWRLLARLTLERLSAVGGRR